MFESDDYEQRMEATEIAYDFMICTIQFVDKRSFRWASLELCTTHKDCNPKSVDITVF